MSADVSGVRSASKDASGPPASGFSVPRQRAGLDDPMTGANLDESRPSPSHRGRVMIVDDHPVVRHGLRELLSHEPDLELCGEAESAEEALRIVGGLAPDLVIVDILLKGNNGIDLVKRLRALHPGVRMLVASMHDESFLAERALRAGAMGYVCKQEPVERMLTAIRSVMRGGVYLTPDMTARIVQAATPHGRAETGSAVPRLSDRELEVFEAIGRGRSTRAIAESLNLSVKTIETHRENIKRKLFLKNSTELVQRAWLWTLMGE
jgi:DNA-binding NarL/FixJ family response regulator